MPPQPHPTPPPFPPAAAEAPKKQQHLELGASLEYTAVTEGQLVGKEVGRVSCRTGSASSGVSAVATNSLCHRREFSQCCKASAGGVDGSFLTSSTHTGTTAHWANSTLRDNSDYFCVNFCICITYYITSYQVQDALKFSFFLFATL